MSSHRSGQLPGAPDGEAFYAVGTGFLRAMIEQVDSELAGWIGGVVGKEVPVSLGPPANDPGPAVSAYLLGLLASPALRGERRTPIQLALRYLVSTAAPSVEQAHALLGSLVVAAMTRPDYAVELDPPGADLWSALGALPRPCFYLRLPLRQELPEPEVKLVRQPLVLNQTHLVALAGRVLGPGDVPLMGAVVEIPAADVSTETDYAGRFLFRAIPADPATKQIRVRARRREMTVSAKTDPEQPLLIRFDQLEG